jgi:hypothetical protein
VGTPVLGTDEGTAVVGIDVIGIADGAAVAGMLDGIAVTGPAEGCRVTGTLDGILDVGVTEGIKVGEIDGNNGERVVGTTDGCCELGIPVGVNVAEYAGIDDGIGDGNSVGVAELLSDGMRDRTRLVGLMELALVLDGFAVDGDNEIPSDGTGVTSTELVLVDGGVLGERLGKADGLLVTSSLGIDTLKIFTLKVKFIDGCTVEILEGSLFGPEVIASEGFREVTSVISSVGIVDVWTEGGEDESADVGGI